MRRCSCCLSLCNYFRESFTTWPYRQLLFIDDVCRNVTMCGQRGVLSSSAWKDSYLAKGNIFWIGKYIKAANFTPTLLRQNKTSSISSETQSFIFTSFHHPDQALPQDSYSNQTSCTISSPSFAWRRPASPQLSCRSH